jgi:DNA (cytosine-5)-methyltransferase 1
MRVPKAIDLFCGCGGLTLGLKQAGLNVVGAIDIDSLAVETYRANHPEVFVWEDDISHISGLAMKRALGIRKGQLDLLAGCPPCQGFSRMRTLNGGREVVDRRNDLVFEFLRLVREFRPKTVMMENVPGLGDNVRIRLFSRHLRDLGYHCEHRILDAADHGVPQRRSRMMLLAGLYGPIDFAEDDTHRSTVRDAIAHLPPAGQSGDPLHDLGERRSKRIAELIALVPKDGGSRLDLGEEYQLACHRRSNGFRDVYGRMSWDDVSPTITTGCFNPSKGRFLHPEHNRAITLREAALLQSFPPTYHFPASRGKSHVSSLIGNALPPEFIRRQAQCIGRYLSSI